MGRAFLLRLVVEHGALAAARVLRALGCRIGQSVVDTQIGTRRSCSTVRRTVTVSKSA
jgi:hypothetical protein